MKRWRLILFSIGLVISGILFLGVISTVSAAPFTLDFTYSGEFYGNGASATGFLTVTDVTVIPNPSPGFVEAILPNPDISALSMTITDASSGNGTFSLADFKSLFWDTGGVKLDFSKELVGQPTLIDPWGSPFGHGGDFTLMGQPGTTAPYGANYFTLVTGSGEGDWILLTSMRARGASVAEPATMLLLGSGLLGLWAFRKKFKK
jgi:hypothetical protein